MVEIPCGTWYTCDNKILKKENDIMYRLKKTASLRSKSAAEIKSSRLGIGFEKLDRDAFDPEKAYDKLAAVGVKWVRIQSGWAKTEKIKGVYDFTWLDNIVDNLIARGMIPWMCMCYGNALYTEAAKEVFGAVGCPPIHTEGERIAWHNYCAATAKHFKGRVTHFEIWNEPDGEWCWKHGVNATEWGQFTVDSARALREGNPDVYIIGGALARTELFLPYLGEAVQTGILESIDALSFHHYVFSETSISQKVRVFHGLFGLHEKSSTSFKESRALNHVQAVTVPSKSERGRLASKQNSSFVTWSPICLPTSNSPRISPALT